MDNTQEIIFTIEECEALYDLIDMLSGGSAEVVFHSKEEKDDPITNVCRKIYKVLHPEEEE